MASLAWLKSTKMRGCCTPYRSTLTTPSDLEQALTKAFGDPFQRQKSPRRRRVRAYKIESTSPYSSLTATATLDGKSGRDIVDLLAHLVETVSGMRAAGRRVLEGHLHRGERWFC